MALASTELKSDAIIHEFIISQSGEYHTKYSEVVKWLIEMAFKKDTPIINERDLK